MFARMTVLAVFGAVGLLAVGPVSAMQPPAAAPASPKKGKTDLEQRRCETITMPGSRLAKKRVCATEAEWRDYQLQDRQATEKIQVGPCVKGAGC